MKNELFKLIDRLENEHSLTVREYRELIEGFDDSLSLYAA